MSLKFWNYNLVTETQTVITATSANAFFPVSNIIDPRRSKVFRSVTPSVTLTFDFITIEEVDSILMLPHVVDGWGFNTPVTVQANATNTWGAPAFTTTISGADVDQLHAIAIKEFPVQSYRFWRLIFSGTSFVEISKLFIGKTLLIGAGRTMDYGWQYVEDDLSIITENRYGQRFVDEIANKKKISFQLSLLNKDELDSVLQVYDHNKRSIPFWMKIDCNGIINDNDRLAGAFYLDAMPAITNTSYGLWSTQLTISEAL